MANKKSEKKTTTKKAVSKTNNKVVKKKEQPKKKIDLSALMQEKNNYGKTIIAALIIVVIFLGGYFILKGMNGNNPFDSITATADEKEFKKEYESINATARTNGQTIKKITIKDKNRIEYIDIEKALEILESGDGVIYFGYAADPLCRNAVPSLIDAAIINNE